MGLNDFLPMERVFEDMQFSPALDVNETDKEVCISAELPGMKEDDIDVSLDNNVLTISGEKRSEREEKSKDVYRMERRWGSFCRSVQLPRGLDVEKAEASYKNGVLSVVLPKTEEYQKSVRKIEVKKDGKKSSK